MKRCIEFSLVVCLFFFIAACEDSSDKPDPDFEDCEECLEANCSAQVHACENDPHCDDILECVGDCVDGGGDQETCINQCVAANPAGEALFNALADCVYENCEDLCIEEGGNGEFEDCEECLEAHCSAQVDACENDPHCEDILGCVYDCVDGGGDQETCMSHCVAANPAGEALFNALTDCVYANCEDLCIEEGNGGDFDDCEECVDTHCSAQLQACENDPDCDDLLECLDDCFDNGGDQETCISHCVAANPDGAALFASFVECIEDHCEICFDDDEDLNIPSISFNGTLYVHPLDSIGGENTVWGLQGTVTGATSSTDGASNTAAAVSVLGDIGIDYAAKICHELDFAGYSDWYLPSRDELNALYQNRASIGNFESLYYWSSTESSNDNAWIQNFADGQSNDVAKGLLARVRCVRRN